MTQVRTLVPDAPAPVAAWFGMRAVRLSPVRDGGFSGAPLILVHPEGGPDAVLKRVATDAQAAARAAWVHRLMAKGRERGVLELPAPLATIAGPTLVPDQVGGWWELLPYVTGTPVEFPTPDLLATALTVLARLHRAWHDVTAWQDGVPVTPPVEAVVGATRPGCPPAMARRVRQAAALARHPWVERWRAVAAAHDRDRRESVSEIMQLWERAIAIFATCDGAAAVARMAGTPPVSVPLQPVIRDIWFQHVLFDPCSVPGQDGGVSPRVAAIIDLHGAAIDTRATDVARLAGSWWNPALGVGIGAWLVAAMDAYAEVHPLAAEERALVPWLHAAGVVCALDNWFCWVGEEERRFADASRVLGRVARLLDALPDALECLAGTQPHRV